MAAVDRLAHKVLRACGAIYWTACADREERQRAVRPWLGQLVLDRVAGDIRDRYAATSCLAAKTSIQSVRKHDRRSLHAYSITR